MAEVIRMPRLSDTMEEGVIVDWFKKKGDKVKAGDVLAEVETDKATMELESYQEGVLLHIGVEKGDTVPIDGILAIIGKEGEDYKELLKEEEAKLKGDKDDEDKEEDKKKDKKKDDEKGQDEEPEEKADKKEKEEPQEDEEQPEPAESGDGSRLKASPLARKMAEDKGIDISKVTGSGDDGRIIKRDIENYKPAAASSDKKGDAAAPVKLPEIVAEESYEEVKVSQMRKTIAKRLGESKFSAPHFYLTMEIEMDACMEARKAINEFAEVKISFNDLIIKAAAAALRKHPAVNSSWLGDTIRYNKHIHIGVAVAIDEGLVVPVVRFADNKTLSHISAEVRQLADKARNKKIQPDDMKGNTFSISNLGMFGIDEFTAIINPPDSCILAVGGISQKLALQDGELIEKNIMKVTLSCDHRSVDGATGAQFLQTFKSLLENPVRILV